MPNPNHMAHGFRRSYRPPVALFPFGFTIQANSDESETWINFRCGCAFQCNLDGTDPMHYHGMWCDSSHDEVPAEYR